MSDQEEDRAKKILLIGSTGYAGITCVDWFAASTPNVADFDIVIVNGVSLANTLNAREGDEETDGNEDSPIDQWRAWLGELQERLRKQIDTQGLVIAIVTNNAVAVGYREMDSMQGPVKIPTFVTSSDWIPLPIAFNDERGDTIAVVENAFRRYFSQVRRWEFTLAEDIEDSKGLGTELASLHDDGGDAKLILGPIAVNRQGAPIAVSASYTVEGLSGYQSGYMFLLPPPTEGTADEAVGIILEDFCGVQACAPDPDWFSEIQVPGEADATAAVESARAELSQAQDRLQAGRAEMEEVTQYKRLLNETGAPLEQIVRKTFATMGLKPVDSPTADFMLVDGDEILVEVKGRTGSIPTSDVAQLTKDMGTFGVTEGRVIKGLLVGNAWRDLPPNERDTADKPVFPDDAVQTAEKLSISLLSTVELFRAYAAVTEGSLTGDEVIRQLRDTVGVVRLVD